MKVSIKSKICSWDPNKLGANIDWQLQRQDSFAFPVEIDSQLCFIKRFKSQPKHWDYLCKLKFEKNLVFAEIFDTTLETNTGEKFHYLIQEYVEGNTLEELTKKGLNVDLQQLGDDIFNAILKLKTDGFWFTDFCEKNIYYSTKKNKYFLIDIDSIETNQILPQQSKGFPGYLINQELAIFVLEFYQNHLNTSSLNGNNIFSFTNGASLNISQLIFLLFKLKYFQELLNSHKTASLNDPEYFLDLVSQLTKRKQLFQYTKGICELLEKEKEIKAGHINTFVTLLSNSHD